jgi:hypothetical protein
VTTEQLIIIGFLAAAFVFGWIARALIARRDRDQPDGPMPAPERDERLERAIDATREELDRAIYSHVTSVALSLNSQNVSPDGGEPVAGELAEEVTAALQDDVANECMLSGMQGENGAGLSERELDLTDWGFAYGVAWARARERDPQEAGEAVAREALEVAEDVFRAYAAEADWANGSRHIRHSGGPS